MVHSVSLHCTDVRQAALAAGAFVVSALHRCEASGAGDGAFGVSALH